MKRRSKLVLSIWGFFFLVDLLGGGGRGLDGRYIWHVMIYDYDLMSISALFSFSGLILVFFMLTGVLVFWNFPLFCYCVTYVNRTCRVSNREQDSRKKNARHSLIDYTP